jgi:RNA polymerase sigma-32 factor
VYGVSAERIRQLEKNAMKKLRQKMGDAVIAA